MSDQDDRLLMVRKWIEKAEHDLQTAAHSLKLGKAGPTDTICFHVQQCVEKYLKALLHARGITFAKTHDVHKLLTLLPLVDRPMLDQEMQERLTDYATVSRYPDIIADPTLAEARKAVAIARRIRREVRRILPRAAVRRPMK